MLFAGMRSPWLRDGADVLDRGRHDEGGQLEPAAGAGLAGGVAAGGVALLQAVDDFLDVADVLWGGERWSAERGAFR